MSRRSSYVALMAMLMGALRSGHAHAQVNDNCSRGGGGLCLTANNSTSGGDGMSAQTTNGIAIWTTDNGTGNGQAANFTSYGTGDTVSAVNNSSGIALSAYSSKGVGVAGVGDSGSLTPGNPYGVWGTSANYDGIHGDVNNTWAAVAGFQSGSGQGVYGQSTSGYGGQFLSTGNDGVHSEVQVTNHAAVSGTCDSGHDCTGVYGNTLSGSNGQAGVYGNNSATTGGIAVKGTCSSSSCYAGYFSASGGGYGVWATTSGDAIYGVTSGTYAIGVYGEGDGSNGVGVNGYCTGGASCKAIQGNANGGSDGYAGYFIGNVYATGSITQNSDERLKKNVTPLTGALDQLLQLKGVTYEWKEPEKHGSQSGTQRGFIAQDVEKVFPGWVGQDAEGFKTLDTRQVEALEVESIRTLKMENDLLKERVAALESGRQPRVAGFNLNGVGFGVGGLALAGAVVFASRRRREERPSQL